MEIESGNSPRNRPPTALSLSLSLHTVLSQTVAGGGGRYEAGSGGRWRAVAGGGRYTGDPATLGVNLLSLSRIQVIG